VISLEAAFLEGVVRGEDGVQMAHEVRRPRLRFVLQDVKIPHLALLDDLVRGEDSVQAVQDQLGDSIRAWFVVCIAVLVAQIDHELELFVGVGFHVVEDFLSQRLHRLYPLETAGFAREAAYLIRNDAASRGHNLANSVPVASFLAMKAGF
jgi:hypothetical protein